MTKKNLISALIFILLGFSITKAQIPFPDNGKLYQDNFVPIIDIIISQDSLDFILAEENISSNHQFRADFIFIDAEGSDTIKDIGFRLRGNSSRTSQKKSFKVSFNTFKKGRKYHGVEKLNLNGEHNDPSIVRSKLCVDLARQMGVISPRANHIMLFINDTYFGLYINVEHIDEEFVDKRFGNKNGNLYKCLYPADLKYLGNNSEYYKKELYGRRIYGLKTNIEEDDYSDLALFVKILNTKKGDDFRCELEKLFDVELYLKNIAFDILTSNWDGYIFNKNNYYLYHNTLTGKFEFILYDVDNTFGIDWFGENWAIRNIYNWQPTSGNRPLYSKILEQPIYRSRFTSIMKETLNSIFTEDKLNNYLDTKKSLISNAAALDIFRTLDYGFSFDDFLNSYKQALVQNHVPIGLKEYIKKRRLSAISQLELSKLLPEIISDRIILNGQDEIQIQIMLNNPELLSKIVFNYSFDDSDQYKQLELTDNGIDGDEQANDNIFSSSFIPKVNYEKLNYYLSISDKKSFKYEFPTCESKSFVFPASIKLAINEFMASNDTTFQDEIGEFDDWIELYNFGSDSIFLGDKYLTDNPSKKSKWKMPEIWIRPNEYMIFWADKDVDQGNRHCNFKLSASGEYIGLYTLINGNSKLIDEVYFDIQKTDVSFGRYPDGTGVFKTMKPTPKAQNTSVSTTNFDVKTGIKLIPNPAKSKIDIQIQFSNCSNYRIQIVDIRGNIIYSKIKANNNMNIIDISKLIPGVYFVRINCGEIYFVSKLVKL